MRVQSRYIQFFTVISVLTLVQFLFLELQSPIRPAVVAGTMTSTPVQSQISRSGGSMETSPDRLSEAYAHIPTSFIANEGQTDKSVKFFTRGRGYGLFLTSTQAVLVLSKDPKSLVVRMRLVGTNPNSPLNGVDELPGKANYFIGSDPSRWRTNIPTYAKVRQREVYPGVDLVYYGRGTQLEYDFEVAPGTNPDAIRLAFEGNEQVSIDDHGNLIVATGGEEIQFLKPLAYQDVAGKQQNIAIDYSLLNSRTVGFKIGKYNVREPLVIDPILSYSTYLGGTFEDYGKAIAVDSAGNAYVTGYTISTNFPTANPLQPANGGYGDAFIAKLNASGTALVYSTFLGGSSGEYGNSIAVDAVGNAYVTGQTQSTNFPISNAFQSVYGGSEFDAFATKLNATGSALIYSTYLGGSLVDEGHGIAADSFGNAYVTGSTWSANFPTVNSLQVFAGNSDAFVTKLNAAGSAVYSTYIGGNSRDEGSSIAVDGSGNAYVAGNLASSPGCISVAKLNAAGSAFVYQACLAGLSIKSIAIDPAGNAYLTGEQYFVGQYRAFVSKLNAAGSAQLYTTYFASGTSGTGIAVDSSGNAYITGSTSLYLATLNPVQPFYGGGIYDAFVAKVNAAGSPLYSTFLGGAANDSGFGIAVDISGNAYVTGSTTSTNFPTANPFQPALAGSTDAFVAKIADSPLGFIPVTPCRVVDTRNPVGALGGPSLVGGTTRAFPITASSCGIPSNAKAYSLNATVVPRSVFRYLTLWPTGFAQPFVSTVNAYDGQVTANAAIVQAGNGGSISAYVSEDTDLILDINGYFLLDTPSSSALSFYPLIPCRVADTRNPAGPLGGPILSGRQPRSFPILLSSCGIPATAQAYVLNATVVPDGFLDYLTLWPTGIAQPFVSNLNTYDGQVTAGMAIVSAGTAGAIDAYATNNTHLVLDITGYFAPAAPGGLRLFTISPCRVVDTRNPNGPFGGPVMSTGTSRSFPVLNSACGVAATAQAYVMNATVIPSTVLNYLTVWPTGSPQPLVSTLNSLDGQITANALIAPAGTGGAVSAFVTNETQLILDLNGFFAP
jgi:hypothetical protein